MVVARSSTSPLTRGFGVSRFAVTGVRTVREAGALEVVLIPVAVVGLGPSDLV